MLQSIGGGFEPEYQAVLNFATANSITTPDLTQNVINNNIVKYLKAVGSWSNWSVFWYMKQPSGLDEFATLNWIDPTLYRLFQPTGGLFPDFDAGKGFKGGNATEKYFRTGYTLSSDTNIGQDNISVVYKSFDVPSSWVTSSVFFGTRIANDQSQILFSDNSNTSNLIRIFSTTQVTTSQLDENKNIIVKRNGTPYSYYREGIYVDTIPTTGAASAISSVEMSVLGVNTNGVFVGNNNQTGLEYLAIGNYNSVDGIEADVYEIMEQIYTP